MCGGGEKGRTDGQIIISYCVGEGDREGCMHGQVRCIYLWNDVSGRGDGCVHIRMYLCGGWERE